MGDMTLLRKLLGVFVFVWSFVCLFAKFVFLWHCIYEYSCLLLMQAISINQNICNGILLIEGNENIWNLIIIGRFIKI